MTASVGRLGEALRLGSRQAWLLAGVGLIALAIFVAQVTRLGALPTAVAVAFAALAVLMSLRWPLLPLVAFVALIPIEEIVLIDGLGTLSKFAGILFAVSYGVNRLRGLSPRLMPPAAWAYLGWAMVSLGWAISPDAASTQLITLLQLFFIAALIADVVVQDPTKVRPLLLIYSLSAAATALVGIATFISAGTRASAIEGQDPAQFAAVLLPALMFGLYEMLDGRRKILGGLIALVTTGGVVVSGTRGAWLSVVVVLFVFILPRLTFKRRVAAVVLIGLIAFATVQIPGVSSLIAQRTGTAIVSGGAGRTDIWSVGLTLFTSTPVFGVGYANFPIADTRAAILAADVSARHLGAGPHNLVIGTMAELGSVGLVLLALFLLPLAMRRGWGPDAAMVQAALASLLIAALFVDLLSDRKQVWLVIGLAAGLAVVQRNRKREGMSGDQAAAKPDDAPRGRHLGPRRRDAEPLEPVTDAIWIVPAYPWDDEPVTGVFYQTQARALARRGVDLAVACPTPGAPWPLPLMRAKWRHYDSAPRTAFDEGVKVIRPRYPAVPGEPRWAFPDRMIADAVWRARDTWSGARLVHGHSAVTGLAAWRLAGRTGLPFVLTFHGGDMNIWPDRHPERVRDLQAAVSDASLVIAVSAPLAAKVEALTGVRAVVLPLGTDHRSLAEATMNRDEARRTLDLADERIVVLFVGNLLAAKGVPELADAIIANGHRFVGVFVGDGPLRDYGTHTLEGARCLRYVGARPHVEIARYMSAADVLVLPSRSEGLPSVLVEAGSIGLPVIASAVGGIPELLGDDRGAMLEDVTVEAITEALAAFESGRPAAEQAATRLHEHVLNKHDVESNAAMLVDRYRTLGSRDRKDVIGNVG